MQVLLERYGRDQRIQQLLSAAQREASLSLAPIHGGLAAVCIACLRQQRQHHRVHLVVCPDPDALSDDLEALGIPATILPELDEHDGDGDADSIRPQLLSQRLLACEAWSQGNLILATPHAVEQPVPNFRDLRAASFQVETGQRHNLSDLAERLHDQGYRVTPLVEEPGQLSQRGSVLDIWPWSASLPVRLDFFDDEVDSIRRFEPDSQETVSRITKVRFSGMGGGLIATEPLWEQIDHAPIIVLGDVPLRQRLKHDHGRPELRLGRTLSHGDLDGGSTTIQRFQGDLHRDLTELSLVPQEGSQLILLARNEEAATDHRHMISEHGLNAEVLIGRLHAGWRDQLSGVVVLHDFELAHRLPNRRRSRKRVSGGNPLSSLADLRNGDYVVHLNHGIARFRGMTTLERRGFFEDFLLLEFAEESRIYVPVAAIDLIQKYIGGSGRHPPLDRLGGKVWAKRRAKAEKAIADLSAELIEAQAKRQDAQGIAHPADDAEQRHFEARFPYEETEDQLLAMREIKQDLQANQPMDRLLCGDVGFGKTELALRAAFKVAKGGHQVILLAPTTILADQHARTFESRLQGHNLRLACLHRFVKTAQRRATLEQAAQGEIDILIGTHALLSKDLNVPLLGLLIIDEEQRFGVRHKEHLRRLRHGVDVLTLSATPIPRTLHFSMLGIRDISVLAEAPAERMAVQTHVSHWDKALLRQAIERELERGGQIFVINNRIEDLDRVAFRLGRLVPEMRYETLHGRMSEQDIHHTMERFRSGALHCLVATTIVESGLDIPNANTLIVHNAHAYGLGELHQLRGRIGRFTRQAYAFFIIPTGRSIGDDARERLDAIQEYADLGAGFKLAMRDLELRGAGNLLGAQQSGHIEAIGYELYCRLLNDAVRRLRGDPDNHQATNITGTRSPRLAFPIDAYIPDEWIEAPQIKFDLHKILENSRRHSDLSTAAQVFRDRFGPLPDPVVRLFQQHALTRACDDLGIERIERSDRQIRLRLSNGIPDMLVHSEVPGLLHVQPSDDGITLFLRHAPDQDHTLSLLCQLCHLDMGYLGREDRALASVNDEI
ncbi:MAG: transcription-repair coupling factor [Planctomycetota bacterium]|nr:MAG: transcription-repair coupling factor [Planctomycetota bacterium]